MMKLIRRLFAAEPSRSHKDNQVQPKFFPMPNQPTRGLIHAMDSGLVQPWRVDANGQQWLKTVGMIQGVSPDYGQHGVHGFVLVEEDEGDSDDDN